MVLIEGASTLTFGDADNRTLAGNFGGSGNDVVLSPVIVQQNEGPKVVPAL